MRAPTHSLYYQALIKAFFLACLCFLFLNTPLFAQETMPEQIPEEQSEDSEDENEEENSQLEEITIIGTRIKQRDLFSASPIVTIDKSDLEISGTATLEESLNQMTQVDPGFGRTGNNPGNGTAQINLRGLGPGRSLVLLNGRRFVGTGFDNAVDLNMIPQAMIEQVEIITGGSAIVYGSDAVAGAVNFITTKDLDGTHLDIYSYITEEGDANINSVSISQGLDFAGDKGSAIVFANYYKREPLMATGRESEAVPWGDNIETGELEEGGSPSTPAGFVYSAYNPTVPPGQDFLFLTFNNDGSPRFFSFPDDLYNYAPDNFLQLPMDRKSAGLFAELEINDGLNLYTELNFTRNDVSKQLAPVPYQGWLAVNPDNPLLHPGTSALLNQLFLVDPGLAILRFFRRMEEVGPRTVSYDTDYQRALFGIRGELGENWEFDAWLTYSDGTRDKTFDNYLSASRMQQAALVNPVTGECFDTSGGCVPANYFGEGNLSVEAADFIRVPSMTNRTTRESWLFSGYITGEVTELPAGTVKSALGFEWRQDESSFNSDPLLFSGDVIGQSASPSVSGTDSVSEIFTESTIPLFRELPFAREVNLELGVRYSNYKYSGSMWTYKAGLEWLLNNDFRIRSMRQRSARAPHLGDLFTEQSSNEGSFVGQYVTNDPCSAENDPVGNGISQQCIIQGLDPDQLGVFQASLFYPTTYIDGGNPNLKPEVGDSWTSGFVWTPEQWPEFSMTMDYYDIEVSDTVGYIPVSQVCFDPANTGLRYCDLIQRDETGNVSQVSNQPQNGGLVKTRGLDTAMAYQHELPGSWALFGEDAELGLKFIWTHIYSHLYQVSPFSTERECAGLFGWLLYGCGSTNPKERLNMSLSYQSGPLTSRLSARWYSSTDSVLIKYPNLFNFDAITAIPKLESVHYIDLSMGYKFTDRVRANLAVRNLLDRQPPFAPSASWSNNTDPLFYDLFGRSYALNLSIEF